MLAQGIRDKADMNKSPIIVWTLHIREVSGIDSKAGTCVYAPGQMLQQILNSTRAASKVPKKNTSTLDRNPFTLDRKR